VGVPTVSASTTELTHSLALLPPLLPLLAVARAPDMAGFPVLRRRRAGAAHDGTRRKAISIDLPPVDLPVVGEVDLPDIDVPVDIPTNIGPIELPPIEEIDLPENIIPGVPDLPPLQELPAALPGLIPELPCEGDIKPCLDGVQYTFYR
jgi:hypothetical protein